MNPARWRQVDEVFQQALERNPAERIAFVRAIAGDDAQLEQEVRSLLEAHERTDERLDEPAVGGVSRFLAIEDEDPASVIGRRFGPYRVTSVIASGGMGSVFLASRDDQAYRKHVAIKLVRRGAGGSSPAIDRERMNRFALERQVLAELEHPYIARLLDGGTTDDGLPYLVMEHVDGLPIDEYCAHPARTLRARLKLFTNVCKAVQHAHQNLIIHRDLKPSNILVTPEGAPKLLDFGLAKLLDPHRAALTSKHTIAGQLMGTIAYAAPEQVSGSPHLQDTRSDVYALGVILYRILTGQHPYSVHGSISDVLRRITDVTPEPPSVSRPGIDGELDTIVLKALAKEQERRYQSAGDLAEDIRRYLAGEAVLAKSDSRWYLLRKTARRYRLSIGIAAAILLMLSTFATLMSVQAARLADRSAALARALRTSNIERGRAMAAIGSVTEAEQILWSEFLASLEGDASSDTDLRERADRLAFWGLWELYFSHPCESTRLADGRNIMRCSRNGRWMILGSGETSPQLFDADRGTIVATIETTAPTGRHMALTEDSRTLVTAETDGEIVEWALPSGHRARRYPGADAKVRTITLDEAHRRVLLATTDGVRVIDRESGTLLLELLGEGMTSRHAALSPDGSLLAVACEDGRVRTFDPTTGTPLDTHTIMDRPPRRASMHVTFDPSGRYLAADINGTDVAVIDTRRRSIKVLTGPTGWINALLFHPTQADPPLLIAASNDKSLYIWEIPSGRLAEQYSVHEVPLNAAVVTPDGSRVITTGSDLMRTWELNTTGAVRRFPTLGTVFGVTFTPDGRRVLAACGDGDNTIRVFDSTTGATLHVLGGHDNAVSCLALEPNQEYLLSGSYDGTVRRWTLNALSAPPKVLARIEGRRGTINSITVSPNGTRLATGSDDATARVWSPTGGPPLDSIVLPRGRVPSIQFSPDGSLLAMAVTPGEYIMVRDTRTGRTRELPAHDLTARVVCFSPGGSLLASAGDDMAIRLWSMREASFGQSMRTLSGHQQDIFALAFSPDGSTLASSGRSGVVKLWDVATGRCLATLVKHTDMVFSLAFSPDGDTLLSGSRDRTVGVWDLRYFDRHIAGNFAYHRQRVKGNPR